MITLTILIHFDIGCLVVFPHCYATLVAFVAEFDDLSPFRSGNIWYHPHFPHDSSLLLQDAPHNCC